MSSSTSSLDVAIPSDQADASRFPLRFRRLWGDGARRGFFGLVDQALVSGTRFLTTVIIGRMCGADELGIYTLAFSLMLVALNSQESFAMGPFIVYGTRLEGRRKSIYSGSVLLQVGALALLAAVALGAAAAVCTVEHWSAHLSSAVGLLALVIPFVLLQQFGRRFALAELDLQAALILDAVLAAIQVGGLSVLALTGNLSATTAFGVVGLACAVPGAVWLCRKHKSFVYDPGSVPSHLRLNWRLGRWMLAAQLISVLGTYAMGWFLALLLDISAAGVYAACASVVCLGNPILLGLSNVLVPEASHAFAAGGHAGARRVTKKAMVLLLGMTGVLAAVLIFFGQNVLLAIYGAEYARHSQVIAILAVGMVFNAAGLAANPAVLAVERSDLGFLSGLLGVVVTCSLGVALIPTWGILGAACGALAGSFVAAVVMIAGHEWVTHPSRVARRTP